MERIAGGSRWLDQSGAVSYGSSVLVPMADRTAVSMSEIDSMTMSAPTPE